MKGIVTGRAGSGKSAVAAELKRRGHNALDSDEVPGLACWQSTRTGEPVRFSDNRYVDLEQYQWIWDTAVLEQLLKHTDDLFLCGSADNDLSFYDKFDKRFVLNIEPSLQIQRLQSRTENDYGSDPRMFEAITAKQARHAAEAVDLGATLLDASLPIEQIVDTLLAAL